MTAKTADWICTECGWQGEPTRDGEGNRRCAGGHHDADLLPLATFAGQAYALSLRARELGRQTRAELERSLLGRTRIGQKLIRYAAGEQQP